MFLRGCQPLGLLSFVFLVVKSSDFSDNQKKNTVALLFEDVTLSSWNTRNNTAYLQKIILNVINVACSNNPSRCSLNFWNDSRKFNVRHVVLIESPKQEEKDLQVKLFVSLPDGSDLRTDKQSVILGATLHEILQAHKSNITSAVGAEVKSINMDSDSESEDNGTDNKMNYIMIPISFSVLIVLCFVACCLHCASKRRQKAIEIERRKQALRKLRASTSKPSAVKSNEGRVPTPNGADENVSMAVLHEDTRKKRRRKQRTERSYDNYEQQERFENDEEREFARKRKKKEKQSKHQRLEGRTTLEPAVLSGQLEEGERERVPTPMPVHRSLNKNTDPRKSFTSEPRERKHRKKTKKKKTRSELREFDEGFDEGSETRQTGNSEDSLIKSLPRPRQLAPLQERNPAQYHPAVV